MGKIMFMMANTVHGLKTAIEGKKSVTIEAEYGDDVVAGSRITLAHHGIRSANPPPCTLTNENFEQERYEGIEVIGLSHFDLDAIGGVMAVLGMKGPGHESFWKLAGLVDVNGVHKLATLGGSPEDIKRLQAWHAWSEAHRVYAPRDGSAIEVSKEVEVAIVAINLILADNTELLAAGEKFEKEQDELNKASFLDMEFGVIARESEHFVNHLYVPPPFEAGSFPAAAKAVVSYNPKTCAVTLSLADPIPGVSCRDIAVQLWGEEAGGHAGIAGGPRSGLPKSEMRKAQMALIKAIEG